MKTIAAIVVTWVAVFVLCWFVLPDPITVAAGSHKGDIYAAGFGVHMFAGYLACLAAGGAAILATVAQGK